MHDPLVFKRCFLFSDGSPALYFYVGYSSAGIFFVSNLTRILSDYLEKENALTK